MFEYHNPSVDEIRQMIKNGQQPMIFYHIPKEEIVKKDLRNIDRTMKTITEVGKGARNSLVLTVGGYDDVTDELYEIKEVRDFTDRLFQKYPYILYYINSNPLFEADTWIVASIADEVSSLVQGKLYTGDELMMKFGLNNENVPRVALNLTFKGGKFTKILKDIINYGKRKKDTIGATIKALDYAYRFDNIDKTLESLGISKEEANDLLSRGDL